MKKLCMIFGAAILALAVVIPVKADARVFVGVGVGCCYYGPGWGYPYYPSYYPGYYAPPVVYAAPQPAVYAQQPAVTYAAPAALPANQTSPTFVDSQGRTCRQFEASSTGAPGMACLLSDGTWHAVQ